MKRRTLFVAFQLFSLVLAFGAVANAQSDDDKTLAPYFVVKGDPNVDQLPLKETRVESFVSGVIADVTVVQIYSNEGSRPINATYVFPASTRAAVYAMRMKIGNEIIYARIKEREEAKKEFEEAKREGKSASLLEQSRPNVFTMSLANVMPGNTIEIELKYTELLVPTDGSYEFVFPTVVGPRYSSKKESEAGSGDRFIKTPYLHEGVKSKSRLSINVRIAAGLPVSDLTSPSHQIAPQWKDPQTATVSLSEEDAFEGNRDFVLRYRLTGSEITSGILLYQGQDENFFLYMAQPPNVVAPESLPPREYVFIVDVSGSMDGFPIATSIKLLEKLIGNLKPTDYFNVVLFAGDSTTLSPTSLPANRENVALAINLLQQQRGSGGTELLGGVKSAMSIPKTKGASRSMLLITDGYIGFESEVFDYIRQNLDQSNIFAFGIGSSVNRYLIEGVAKAGMGEPFVVTDPAEAETVAEKFRTYVQSPLLTDVRVKIDGFDVYDVMPLNQPDLFARRPVIVFGKWKGDVTGTIELSGTNGNGPYRSLLDLNGFEPDEGNSALRYLWARSRIAELSDYGIGEPSENAKKEITALGLKYNLLTNYTSFIAVREKIVNPNGSADDVEQAQPLPMGVTDLAIGTEPEFILLFGIAVILAMFILLRNHVNANSGGIA